MTKRIILIGSKGMLGQMVYSFFESVGYEILKFDRRFDANSIKSYVEELNSIDKSIVINCIGRIKQKSDDPYDLFLSNSILPLELARSLKLDHLLIHPSTDCVFDGTTSTPYLTCEGHTATDLYGISKSLGETAIISRPNSFVVRVSIIGPDANSDKGLLSWFLSHNPGSELKGYNNHLWNGITTLEWSEKIFSFLSDNNLLNNIIKMKVVQLGTNEVLTKFEMLNIFNSVFNTKQKIILVNADNAINRCLKPDFVSPSLDVQIRKLYVYMNSNL